MMTGRKRVLTTGVFALPTAHHFALLSTISALYPEHDLLVGINGDEVTRRLKWYACLPAEARAAALSAHRAVADVIIFEEPTPTELIRRLRPDVFVKGADWKGKNIPEKSTCIELGTMIEFIDAGPVHTTDLLREIIRRFLALPPEEQQAFLEGR